MTTKNKADSINQRLLAIQKKLGVSFEHISTSFLIERLVARLMTNDKIKKSLVFKGGFVSLKVYESERYTIDLDALLLKSDVKQILELTKQVAAVDLDDGVWFHFQEEIDLQTQGEYGGIRQVFRAGIGPKLRDLKKAKLLNFDLGFGDPVTPAPHQAKTKAILGEDEISWSVYPVETIVAEKIHALVSLGAANSRSKDVYDLSIFLAKAEPKILKDALKRTFKYRNTNLPATISDSLKSLDTKSLKRGWTSATSTLKDAPSFDESFQIVIDELAKLEKES